MKKLFWLLAISLFLFSCTKNELPIEIYEYSMEKINQDSGVVISGDSLLLLNDSENNLTGPYTASRRITVPSIISPINAVGTIMITATIEYQYWLQDGGMKYLYSVDKIKTEMKHTTGSYLIWTDLGSLYGPINIQDLDERFVDYRIYGKITGSEGFFHQTNPANEVVDYRGSFNINTP